MMEINEYTVGDLKKLLHQQSFWESKILPITRHRALSHINNPRAKEDDVVLLTASENNEILSYTGILPDYFYREGIPIRMGWGSTGWVNPEKKNTWAYGILMVRVGELYNKKTAVCSVSDSAKIVFDKTKGLKVLKEIKGIRVLFLSEFRNTLPSRKPFFKKIAFLLALLDAVLNLFLRSRLFLWKSFIKLKGIRYERIEQVDKDSSVFIDKFLENDLTKRGAVEFNWILNFPWVLSREKEDNQKTRYYFSSFADNFDLFGVKVFSEDQKLIGFLMVRIQDNHMNIPYMFFEKQNIQDILRVIRDLVFQSKAEKLTIYNDYFVDRFNSISFPYFRKSSPTQLSYINTKFGDLDLDKVFLHEGDGDCVFT